MAWFSVNLSVMLKCAVLCCVVFAVALLHLYWTHSWILMELKKVKKECNNYNCCCSGVAEQHNFLHLVPASIQSYDELDTSVIIWAIGQSQGSGLKVAGESITVAIEGLYFIYSQVLYKDPTWLMGHVVAKRLNGAETKLMRCLKSMPSNVSMPRNTCYTAGVHFLEAGSALELSVPRKSANLVLSAQVTFMGIFSI